MNAPEGPAHLVRLYRPKQVAFHHWKSIPTEVRIWVRVAGYLLSLAAAIPIFLGWARVSDTAVAGIAVGATALAALLFALGIQIFAMAADFGAAATTRKRRENIHDANLLRGLLANVLYCTMWAVVASIAATLSSFISWLWVARGSAAVGAAALVQSLLSFMLTVRRLFDLADERFGRAHDPPEQAPSPSTPGSQQSGP